MNAWHRIHGCDFCMTGFSRLPDAAQSEASNLPRQVPPVDLEIGRLARSAVGDELNDGQPVFKHRMSVLGRDAFRVKLYAKKFFILAFHCRIF